jgi:F1F0 ATPase subunit 2
MNELINLALGLVWGAVLGVFYFGGLWLTIRHLPQSQQPSLLTLGSFLGRSAVCLFGFYLAVGNSLEVLIFSLAGFVLTKMALVRIMGPNSRTHACKEAS